MGVLLRFLKRLWREYTVVKGHHRGEADLAQKMPRIVKAKIKRARAVAVGGQHDLSVFLLQKVEKLLMRIRRFARAAGNSARIDLKDATAPHRLAQIPAGNSAVFRIV